MVRKTLFALALCLTVAGCFDKGDERLVGKWVLDTEGFKQLDEYKNATQEERSMLDFVLASAKVEVEFTKDTIKIDIEAMGQKKTDEASYRISSTDGDRIVLETTDSKGVKEISTVEFRDGMMLIDMGMGQTIALRRK